MKIYLLLILSFVFPEIIAQEVTIQSRELTQEGIFLFENLSIQNEEDLPQDLTHALSGEDGAQSLETVEILLIV